MTSIHISVVYVTWAAIFAIWMFGRIGNKRTISKPNIKKFLLTTGILYLSYIFLLIPPILNLKTTQFYQLNLLGSILCVSGAIFAIWARFTLGKNWSGVIATQKENHSLVKEGPYQFVRHPIYTGLILVMLGSALVIGTAVSYFALLLGTISLLLRIPIEEKLMNEMFPDSYIEYSRKVKRLIPFIW